MTKFKLNKKYDHRADIISDAFHIEKERSSLIIDEVIKYWDSLSPEKFMRSKILDFIEQQDWTIIEKLYAVDRFTLIYEDEASFGYYDEKLLNYIINIWKEKGTVTDEDDTREYLKHMFKLLSGYNLECLIDTLKDVSNLANKFESNSDNEDEDEECEITSEQIDEQKKVELMSNAIQNINKVLPDSIGIAIFSKEGYIITAKNQEFADIISETLKCGQKGFITNKEANLNFYQ